MTCELLESVNGSVTSLQISVAMMKPSGSEKGKRPVTEKMEPCAVSMEPEEEAAVAADAGMRASGSCSRMMMQKEEEEPKAPHLLEGSYSSLTFTELLAQEGNSCSGLDKIEEESDGERMKGGKRGSSQLPNLDLSLLPSRESFDLFRTPQKNTNQWPPFAPFRPPYFGGFSPLNINAFSNQQQQCTQLTIFYGGTVNVYNVSADMARAIMVLAGSGVNTKANSTAGTPTSFAPATPATVAPLLAAEIVCPSPLPTGRATQIQPPFTLKAANLPISRKNSLQRFLEKRNDRLHARAPYAPLRQN